MEQRSSHHLFVGEANFENGCTTLNTDMATIMTAISDVENFGLFRHRRSRACMFTFVVEL